MKIYNTNGGFILLSIMFIMSMMFLAGKCPCDDIEKTRCLRYEFYGVQWNHLSMFMVIGLFFPSFFFTLFLAIYFLKNRFNLNK